MKMVSKAFVKFNKVFMQVCACVASINKEFDIPAGKLTTLFNVVTIFFGLVVLITNLLKFLTFETNKVSITDLRTYLNSYPTTSDLLLLNYLPRVSDFGKLYYGLISTTVGTPLAWRIYLNHYRPYASPAEPYRNETKTSLIRFYMEGSYCQPGNQGKIRSIATVFARCVGVLEDARYLAVLIDHDVTEQLIMPIRGRRLEQQQQPLTSVHEKVKSRYRNHEQNYRNPMRVHNFLNEYNETRWEQLACYVYGMVAFIVVVSIPLMYCIVRGLCALMQSFTYDGGDFKSEALRNFGIIEQYFAISQAAMIFSFTNIFITIIYADLVTKGIPLRKEVERLNRYYQLSYGKKTETQLSREEIHMQQLRIWAYFDNIVKLDDFVSKYSLVSMIIFVVGISFGQSYMRVEEMWLKCGTASALASNLISFSYLYLISWDIERRGDKIHKSLLSIVARDSDFVTQRIWQKTLVGFFGKDWNRTFTLDGRYPLNLHSYFKAMFYFVTLSAVIFKLFHKNSYELGFSKENA